MEQSEPRYSPLYTAYLYYFNEKRDYYECHEVLEELWMEERRSPLYQGLLQVAVALYHCRNDNFNGARKLFSQAINKLQHYPDDSLGIRLDKLLAESRDYLEKLHRVDDSEFVFYDLNIEIVDPLLIEEVNKLKLYPPEYSEL